MNNHHLHSIHHVRDFEFFKLEQLSGKIDIMISHDWPAGITSYGNVGNLLRFKPHFQNDIQNNCLGSPPSFSFLKSKKPTYWFSAHLHCFFPAIYNHPPQNEKDEIQKTKFLGIDKVIPGRRFLQVIELEMDEKLDKDLRYDLEWLAITKNTHHLISFSGEEYSFQKILQQNQKSFVPSESELNQINLLLKDSTIIPQNFVKTLPSYLEVLSENIYEPYNLNPQTKALLETLQISSPTPAMVSNIFPQLNHPSSENHNPEEINLDF